MSENISVTNKPDFKKWSKTNHYQPTTINMAEIKWICKHFELMTPHELYAMLRLRCEVFVVEQKCLFLDIDGNDNCYHLMGFDGDLLVASTRLLAPNTVYEEMSIGRVVSAASHRGVGIGQTLMRKSIEQCYQLFGFGTIKIGAQLYLKKFYESFGFQQIGTIYLEDDIEHIKMIKKC